MGWLGLAKEEVASTHEARPEWAQRDSHCFAPGEDVRSQLWATSQERHRLAHISTVSAITHQPAILPAPYRYALHSLGGYFDVQSQVWSGEGVAMPLLDEAAVLGHEVVLEGRLQPGVCELPVPMYGLVEKAPEVLGAGTLTTQTPGWTGGLRVLVEADAPVLVRYRVRLLQVPMVTQVESSMEAALLCVPTVPLQSLPGRVQRFVEGVKLVERSWERAMAVQSFVRAHYLYDDAFMERPEVQKARRGLREGQGNHHLTLLHASGDETWLGRGICYELNVLVVELLRHVGVPSLVATGWTLTKGVLQRPDHLWAIAVLPVFGGSCWFPLDAATGEDGTPRTPLALPQKHAPASSLSVPSLPKLWNAPTPPAMDLQANLESLRRTEANHLAQEWMLLWKAFALYEAVHGPSLPEFASSLREVGVEVSASEVATMREVLRELLGGLDVLTVFQRLLSGDLRKVDVVTEEVQILVKLGLVELKAVSLYEVLPLDVAGDTSLAW